MENSAHIIAKLEQRLQVADYRMKRTKEDRKKKEELKASIRDADSVTALYKVTDDELKKIESDLRMYSEKKEEEALAGIYSGIYSAQSIIPETEGIELKIGNGKAKLVTDEGIDVNLKEGSGFRAMLSFLVRDIILENSEYENFAIYDEPLATLSGENSAELSVLFNILGKRKQLIVIEQKPEIFANIEGLTVYEFSKVEGKTLIRKVG